MANDSAYRLYLLRMLKAELNCAMKSKRKEIVADSIGRVTAEFAQLIGVEHPSYPYLTGVNPEDKFFSGH